MATFALGSRCLLKVYPTLDSVASLDLCHHFSLLATPDLMIAFLVRLETLERHLQARCSTSQIKQALALLEDKRIRPPFRDAWPEFVNQKRFRAVSYPDMSSFGLPLILGYCSELHFANQCKNPPPLGCTWELKLSPKGWQAGLHVRDIDGKPDQIAFPLSPLQEIVDRLKSGVILDALAEWASTMDELNGSK